IRSVRERFPDAYIACLTAERCREILELNPSLNDIMIYDEQGRHRSMLGKIRLIAELRQKKFDTVILVHRSFTRALLVALAGIPRRIGYRTKKRSALLTDKIEQPIEQMHRVDYFLSLGEPLGAATGKREYEFFISENDRLVVAKRLAARGIGPSDFVAAINPGGNWEPKRWPKENFALLADALVKRFGAKIVITGAKRDIPLAGEIARAMGSAPLILCGETTLKELGAVFARATVVVANDSGPMHIAAAIGANTVALFGPTHPEITGPIGRGRHLVVRVEPACEVPCYDLSCKDHRCMSRITVAQVVAAIEKMLAHQTAEK
ncbi:MAG: lipopolysaccharide heptosyltransferase II, partial [Candidatus Omnitrophota bacterium]